MGGQLRSIRASGARRPLAVDAAIAAVLAAVLAIDVAGRGGDPLVRWAFFAALVVPLVWRRRAPATVFAVVALVACGQWLVATPDAGDAALLVALYSVAAHERRRWLLGPCAVALAVGIAFALAGSDEGIPLVSFAGLASSIVAAGALGTYVRTRRAHVAALLERAAQLERERDQQAQLAVAAERARIARELHDVVAHSLTVMVALADGARLTAPDAPAEAEAAIATVAATGREALREMRRLLGVLRDDDHGDHGPQLAPQPGIAELAPLVDHVRDAGLAVTVTASGEPVPLSAGAQLAVYRVVQEALTNTLKHAPDASSAAVRLDWSADALAVEVTDDGARTAVAAHSGHGLAGMRERLAAYGAAVEAGPRPHGGWRVRTRLPIDGQASA